MMAEPFLDRAASLLTVPPSSPSKLARERPAPSRGAWDERTPDAELVSRARTGDRWAQETIFRRHVEAVMGLSTRLLGSVAEADDVVQDTFAAALSRLDRLDDPARLRSWLLGIAVHRAQRRLRARKVRAFFGLTVADPVLLGLAVHDASPEVRATLKQVDRLLQRAPVEQRLAWLLRHVEGHKLEEIAGLTGCSLATVKRRIDAIETRLQQVREEAE